jgi:hypothetical protein
MGAIRRRRNCFCVLPSDDRRPGANKLPFRKKKSSQVRAGVDHGEAWVCIAGSYTFPRVFVGRTSVPAAFVVRAGTSAAGRRPDNCTVLIRTSLALPQA